MDRMASIEMALMNEQTEMTFYRNEAGRSRNPLARAMFEHLAKDEEEHMKRIRALHERLVSRGTWPQDVPLEVSGTRIGATLAQVAAGPGSADGHDGDDIEALNRAIAFEQNGEDFYRKLAETSSDPREKPFFDFLAGIEREHRLSLLDTLSYLKDPRGWLETHERSGLDGA